MTLFAPPRPAWATDGEHEPPRRPLCPLDGDACAEPGPAGRDGRRAVIFDFGEQLTFASGAARIPRPLLFRAHGARTAARTAACTAARTAARPAARTARALTRRRAQTRRLLPPTSASSISPGGAPRLSSACLGAARGVQRGPRVRPPPPFPHRVASRDVRRRLAMIAALLDELSSLGCLLAVLSLNSRSLPPLGCLRWACWDRRECLARCGPVGWPLCMRPCSWRGRALTAVARAVCWLRSGTWCNGRCARPGCSISLPWCSATRTSAWTRFGRKDVWCVIG